MTSRQYDSRCYVHIAYYCTYCILVAYAGEVRLVAKISPTLLSSLNLAYCMQSIWLWCANKYIITASIVLRSIFNAHSIGDVG